MSVTRFRNQLEEDLLNNIQHDCHHETLSSRHFRLNYDYFLEIITVKDPSFKLTELSDKLIALKVVLREKLEMSRLAYNRTDE